MGLLIFACLRDLKWDLGRVSPMRIVASILVITLGLVPSRTTAQDAVGRPTVAAHPHRIGGLAQGARIRVTLREPYEFRLVGTYLSTDGDSLLRIDVSRAEQGPFPIGPGQVAFPRIVRLEQSYGRHRHTLRGAVLGLVGGAALGTIFAATFLSGHPTSEGWNAGGVYRWSEGVGIGAGLCLGTLMGLASQSDTWREIPIPRARSTGETSGEDSHK